jgi:hypothetical protein
MEESSMGIVGASHGTHQDDHSASWETQLHKNSFASKEHHSSLLFSGTSFEELLGNPNMKLCLLLIAPLGEG